MILLIVGCGIDLVKTERIEKIIKKWGDNFSSRIFTPLEQKYCEKKGNKYHSYTGKFAAKEAFLKALGLGLRGINWKDIEVLNNKLGQPVIKLTGKLKEITFKKDIGRCFITISHTKEYAIAQVILEALFDE